MEIVQDTLKILCELKENMFIKKLRAIKKYWLKYWISTNISEMLQNKTILNASNEHFRNSDTSNSKPVSITSCYADIFSQYKNIFAVKVKSLCIFNLKINVYCYIQLYFFFFF